MYEITYAKNKIAGVYRELVISNPAKEISIQQIVNESNLSRTTFYKNFKDKSELIDYCFQKDLSQIPKKPDKDEYINLIEAIFNNKIFYYKILCVDTLSIILFDCFFTNFKAYYYEKYKDTIESTEIFLFKSNFMSFGFTHTIINWIQSNFKISLQELTNLINNALLNDIIKNS